ncbi:MAG: OmpA family protein [Actinomycetota bacterium]
MGRKKTSQRLQQIDRRGGREAAPPPPGFRPSMQDDAAITWAAFIAGSILVFLIFAALAVFSGIRSVEADIEERSEQALEAAGFPEITAEADGYDVSLKGQYVEGQDIESASLAVAQLEGVSAVDASGVWEVEAKELQEVEVIGEPIAFSWTGDSITVTGDVSTEDQRAFVEESLAALIDDRKKNRFETVDAGGVAVREGLTSENEWLGKVVGLIGVLANHLDEGSVTANSAGEVVTTAGKAETRQDKRDLTDASEELVLALGSVGFDVTDGVLGPPKPPAPTKREVEELDRTLAELIEGKVVEFEFNSDELTEVGKALLNEIVLALREFPNVPVEIGGHADAQGSAKRNMELSRRRADAVVVYLVSLGEDADRFVAVGYGDTVPIADNATAEGRAKNRRIEFNAIDETEEG